jgi:hypothetical protein
MPSDIGLETVKEQRLMKLDTQNFDADAVLRALRADPAAMPWNERFELARQVCDALQAGEANRQILALVKLFARDSKWEVRAAIADTLLSVPGSTF